MEFRILGPMEVWQDGRAVPLAGPKQRAVLAILLLNANQPVSRDRLIEGLWGERPPPSAPQTLDSYLSKLRRALGGDRIVRRAPGYLLRIEPGELDLASFTALVTAAGSAKSPVEAARLLRQALGLWRGVALCDVLYEPFANQAAEALEERRLGALELRIDADLASGDRAGLVAELDGLVRQHPLREHFAGQLMLALYRDGRQADALAVMQRARHVLAEQLGLGPGPRLRELERMILQQEAELDAEPRPAASQRVDAPAGRTRRALVVAAAATVVGGALVAALVVTTTDGGFARETRSANAANRLLALDDASGRPAGSSDLRGSPAAMAFGDGSLWITHPSEQEVVRVDASTQAIVDRIPVAGQPGGIVYAAGTIWVASTLGGSLVRIDPSTDRVTQTIRLGGANTGALAYDDGRLWVADTTDRSLIVLDARTGATTDTYALDLRPTALAAGPDGIFVADSDQHSVVEVDRRSGAVLQEIAVGNGPAALAEADGSLWVANSLDGTITRIDPDRGAVERALAVGSGPSALVGARGAVYVANQYSGSVSRIDTRTNHVTATAGGGAPIALAAGAGKVWVGSKASSAGHRGGTLAIVSAQWFTTLDPALQYHQPSAAFGKLAYDGLVSFEMAPGPAGLRVVPDLALALPSPANGGTTYTFRLRRGIRYSDGRSVRAADFRRAIERLFLVDSPGASLFAGLAGASRCTTERCHLPHGIETENTTGTVTFRLRAPDPDFFLKLTTLQYAAPIPPGIPDHDIGANPVPGTGPYRMLRLTRKEIRFVRNPYFREWSHAAQPAGNPDQIVWRRMPSFDAAVHTVSGGRADWIYSNFSGSQLQKLQLRFPAQVHTNPAFIFDFIPLNTHLPPFDDVRVRRAVNLAIDRAKVARLYGGAGIATPWCQVIPPGMQGHEQRCPYTLQPGNAHWSAPDLASARHLIAASGTRGQRIDVWGSTDEGSVPGTVVTYFGSLLRALGYRAHVHFMPASAYTPALRRRIQLSVDGDWLADYPAPSSYLPGFFGCNGGYSNGYVCDPDLEREMADAATLQVTEPNEAAGAWARVDRRITDEAFWIPTVRLNSPEFVSGRLRNYEYHPAVGFLAAQAWLR